MKLYGGSSNSAHTGNRSGIPRWLQYTLVVALSLALLCGVIICVIKLVSKPPERPAPTPPQNETVEPTPPAQEDPPTEQPEEEEQPDDTETVAPVEDEEEEVKLPTEEPPSYKDGVYNILICGTDGDGLRTDTIIIANLNANDHTVSLMSIPRDTLIDGNYTIPKINSAFTVGGVERLKTELAKLLGFPVDGSVVVDLEAFIKIVDLVGGVEFDVPQDMKYSDPSQDLEIDLKKGLQLLDGEHALQLVRFRNYAAADLQRIKVQQDFLKALANKALSIGSLTKIGEYAEIVMEYVETDLSLGNIIWFGEQLLQCDFNEMKTYTPSGENAWVNGASCYALYESSVLKIVNEAFNPYDRDLTSGDVTVRKSPVYEPVDEAPSTETEQTEIPEQGGTSAPPDGYILPGGGTLPPNDETTENGAEVPSE